jgi:hypothetical protein
MAPVIGTSIRSPEDCSRVAFAIHITPNGNCLNPWPSCRPPDFKPEFEREYAQSPVDLVAAQPGAAVFGSPGRADALACLEGWRAGHAATRAQREFGDP